jgi:hypothetical protein
VLKIIKSQFKIEIYLHFVIIGLKNESYFLNKQGIKIDVNETQNSYVLDQMVLTHFWVKPDDEILLWKFFANCELQIYMSESKEVNEETSVYKFASGFPFKNAKNTEGIQTNQLIYYFFGKEEPLKK